MVFESCCKPIKSCFRGGGGDKLMWDMKLKPHAAGDYSIAVVQANSALEDQGQVFTSPSATYVGVYDGHGGPEASRFITSRLFPFLDSMDSKVKQMIKLMEEDADLFARKAEMYRALAERYDHATGVLRHAHKTMVEAFPDQAQSLMNGDVDSNSPFMPPSVRDFFDPNKSHKDALGLSSPDIHVAKRNVEEEPESEKLYERVSNAEAEVELLNGALIELKAEKVLVHPQYQQCLDILEEQNSPNQEEARETSDRAERAQSEVQHLHNESQEELTSLASELQNSAQTVLDLEAQNHCFQEEVSKIRDEKRTLSEINLSSEASMENMHGEILTLRATIVKLQEEIEIRMKEKNDLQQENIEHLREELDELKQKHRAVLEQMESLELDPASFSLSVLELRNNCSKLNDAYDIEKSENAALMEKLDIMAELLEKNVVLENSVASLNTELQQVKEKVKTSEETYQSLIEEKSIIVSEKDALQSQFQVLTENSGVLSEKNVYLENSLADTNDELTVLKENSRRLEESLSLIGIEKTGLLNKTETLSSQLDITRQKLEETEINCEELELSNFNLLTVKQLLVCSIGDLHNLLKTAKQDAQGSYKILRQDNSLVIEEKKSLTEELEGLFGALLNERTKMQRSIEDLKGECNNLRRRVEEGDRKEMMLINDIKELKLSFLDAQGSYKNLQQDNSLVLKEKKSLMEELEELLGALLYERTKMQRAIEDLKGECNNLKAIKEKQTEQIIKLLEDNKLKTVENDDLWGSKNTLEAELLELVKKHEIVKTKEATLKSELQRWEIKEHLCEKEFEELFRTLQISAVNEAFYHEKFYELHEKLESMMSKVSAADTEAQLQKNRIIALEVENAELKTHFSEYDSAVSSLFRAVTSLENHTISHDKLSQIHKNKDAGSSLHLINQVCVQEDNSNALLTTRCSELKNLQTRIQVVELAVHDIQKLASQGSPGSSVRPKASMLDTNENGIVRRRRMTLRDYLYGGS